MSPTPRGKVLRKLRLRSACGNCSVCGNPLTRRGGLVRCDKCKHVPKEFGWNSDYNAVTYGDERPREFGRVLPTKD